MAGQGHMILFGLALLSCTCENSLCVCAERMQRSVTGGGVVDVCVTNQHKKYLFLGSPFWALSLNDSTLSSETNISVRESSVA